MKRKHSPGVCYGYGGNCHCTCKCCTDACSREIREVKVRIRWLGGPAIDETVSINKTICKANCYLPIAIGCTGPVTRLVRVGEFSANYDNNQRIHDFKFKITIPTATPESPAEKFTIRDCIPLSQAAMVNIERANDNSNVYQSFYWEDERYVTSDGLTMAYGDRQFLLNFEASGTTPYTIGEIFPSPRDLSIHIQDQIRALNLFGEFPELADATVEVEMFPQSLCEPLDDVTFFWSDTINRSFLSLPNAVITGSRQVKTYGVLFEIIDGAFRGRIYQRVIDTDADGNVTQQNVSYGFASPFLDSTDPAIVVQQAGNIYASESLFFGYVCRR